MTGIASTGAIRRSLQPNPVEDLFLVRDGAVRNDRYDPSTPTTNVRTSAWNRTGDNVH